MAIEKRVSYLPHPS